MAFNFSREKLVYIYEVELRKYEILLAEASNLENEKLTTRINPFTRLNPSIHFHHEVWLRLCIYITNF